MKPRLAGWAATTVAVLGFAMLVGLASGPTLRYCLAGLALLSVAALGACAVLSKDWDQSARFGVIVGYSLVTVAGQLQGLTRPVTWVTYALAVVVAAGLVTAGRYLARTLPGALRGGDGEA